MTVTKTFAKLTAVLSDIGVSVYWPDGTLQRRVLLGNMIRNEFGIVERTVFIPFEVNSFGFTEADLNSIGYATAVRLPKQV